MKEWFGEKILGLPQLASSNGRGVDDLIIYVHWLMLALFIGWLIYFLYAIRRFRSSRHPKADYHGVRSHASNYLEVGVALVEAVLLIFVAVPIWAKAVNKLPSASESTVVQVVAQQFAWNVRYAGPDGVFGKQDMKFVKPDNVFGVDPSDPNGKDDIQLLNEIHVPVNKPVIIYLSSKDVIHSLKSSPCASVRTRFPACACRSGSRPPRSAATRSTAPSFAATAIPPCPAVFSPSKARRISTNG